jgi:predicted nuclease of restriction endonuclease-like (RecB) superfamily
MSWSHYCELLKVGEPLARSFYEKECSQNNWSVRELKRQINAMLFEISNIFKSRPGMKEPNFFVHGDLRLRSRG